MGKKGGGGGSSWLTAVKRAFRSPSKDSEKRSTRRKDEQHIQDQLVDHDEEDKVLTCSFKYSLTYSTSRFY